MIRTTLARLVPALLALFITGCGTIVHKQSVGQEDAGPRKIVVFFDGTHNDAASDTNVKRLHSLVSLQARPDLYALYIEGVGTGSDVIGMGAGAGIGARVRLGYEFVMQHYRPNDEIYISGFSRGAYSARILNSLLYRAGVPRKPDDKTYTEASAFVYEAVTGHFDYSRSEVVRPQSEIREFLAKHSMQPNGPVEVKALALWDTVAALGLPEWGKRLADKAGMEVYVPTIDDQARRYGDTLCNVKAAYHALAIDDDREWIFTPLPLTRAHLFAGCEGHKKDITLREVWFAGAHSDVGGGYDDTQLSGVSLNWMIEQLAGTGLVPAGARVREDVHGTSHNPEGGVWSPLYHRMSRDIARYPLDATSLRKNTLCVHESVFNRRKIARPREFENQQLDLRQPGPVCLVPGDSEDEVFRKRRKQGPAASCNADDRLEARMFVQNPGPNEGCVEALQ